MKAKSWFGMFNSMDRPFVSFIVVHGHNVDEKGQWSEANIGPTVCTCTTTYTTRSWVVLRLTEEIYCDSPSEEGNVSWSFLSCSSFNAQFWICTPYLTFQSFNVFCNNSSVIQNFGWKNITTRPTSMAWYTFPNTSINVYCNIVINSNWLEHHSIDLHCNNIRE